MDYNLIESLLERYLKGETSIAENELIERWLEENGDANSPFHQLDQHQKTQWLTGIFSDLQKEIHPTAPKVVILPRNKIYWRQIAAVAAIVTILFSGYWEWPALQQIVQPSPLTVLTVPAHQKKQIILADGSKVWVNAGSELRYPKEFKGKLREVYLSGEAYFDIYHDTAKPFIIHTGKLITTVLGTAFNIKEDKTLHTIVVTVTRGKVGVANEGHQLGMITPNQQISFNSVNEKAVQTDVNAQEVIAWQGKELYFDDITFADAAAQLQKRFHVKIAFSNERLKTCQFSGTALTGAKLDEILNVICAFNKATYQTKEDGSILIDGPGCN